METRNILIANTKTQKRYNIETAATTLGELKAQLTAQGIDYEGMSFTEGITQTELLSNDSMLPTNVMFKGAPTNNLVMLLSNTQKNISSGASFTRKDAYTIIKADKELQQIIKDECGRNYTQVSTGILWQYIYPEDIESTQEEEKEEPVEAAQAPIAKPITAPHKELVAFIYDGIKLLTNGHQLITNDIVVLSELITELAARLKESEVTISDTDIDDMIARL